MSKLDQIIEEAIDQGILSLETVKIFREFLDTYKKAVPEFNINEKFLIEYIYCVIDDLKNPYIFPPYHQMERSPYDYYTIGQEMFRPLIKLEQSQVLGENQLLKIEKQLDTGDNVIFFANHQAEPDPQAITLLLEKKHPSLAEDMIFVAGHKVTTDPLAKPFSRGRNLLCIYSKRHIDHPPEEKQSKLQHNQLTMYRMAQLLANGGKCIYVAPSGGRDRINVEGKIEVAPLNPESVEMFWLMAKKAGRTTHFYPMSLNTYHLLPPPQTITKDLGEARIPSKTAIQLFIGDEIDMVHYPGFDSPTKKERRQMRAQHIYKMIKDGYNKITKDKQ